MAKNPHEGATIQRPPIDVTLDIIHALIDKWVNIRNSTEIATLEQKNPQLANEVRVATYLIAGVQILREHLCEKVAEGRQS